ncbi:hypothetical protein HZA86_04865 [Candidatus Uhrbacteria bacterium]|nr:hypothetical protein [Candidatus Uhrbacteria bacterium]
MQLNPNKNRFHRERGNTVLEMLIALFVITTGLFAIIGLSFGNAVQTKTSLNEVQAANFAREGIEIVRNIRDSNKYKRDATGESVRWNAGINIEGDYAINTAAIGTDNPILIAKTSSPDNTTIAFQSNQFVQPGPSSGATKYHRAVQLYPICSSGSTQVDDLGSDTSSSCVFNDIDSGQGGTIGVQVIARVTWQEGGRARKIEVEDRLYNW